MTDAGGPLGGGNYNPQAPFDAGKVYELGSAWSVLGDALHEHEITILAQLAMVDWTGPAHDAFMEFATKVMQTLDPLPGIAWQIGQSINNFGDQAAQLEQQEAQQEKIQEIIFALSAFFSIPLIFVPTVADIADLVAAARAVSAGLGDMSLAAPAAASPAVESIAETASTVSVDTSVSTVSVDTTVSTLSVDTSVSTVSADTSVSTAVDTAAADTAAEGAAAPRGVFGLSPVTGAAVEFAGDFVTQEVAAFGSDELSQVIAYRSQGLPVPAPGLQSILEDGLPPLVFGLLGPAAKAAGVVAKALGMTAGHLPAIPDIFTGPGFATGYFPGHGWSNDFGLGPDIPPVKPPDIPSIRPDAAPASLTASPVPATDPHVAPMTLADSPGSVSAPLGRLGGEGNSSENLVNTVAGQVSAQTSASVHVHDAGSDVSLVNSDVSQNGAGAAQQPAEDLGAAQVANPGGETGPGTRVPISAQVHDSGSETSPVLSPGGDDPHSETSPVNSSSGYTLFSSSASRDGAGASLAEATPNSSALPHPRDVSSGDAASEAFSAIHDYANSKFAEASALYGKDSGLPGSAGSRRPVLHDADQVGGRPTDASPDHSDTPLDASSGAPSDAAKAPPGKPESGQPPMAKENGSAVGGPKAADAAPSKWDRSVHDHAKEAFSSASRAAAEGDVRPRVEAAGTEWVRDANGAYHSKGIGHLKIGNDTMEAPPGSEAAFDNSREPVYLRPRGSKFFYSRSMDGSLTKRDGRAGVELFKLDEPLPAELRVAAGEKVVGRDLVLDMGMSGARSQSQLDQALGSAARTLLAKHKLGDATPVGIQRYVQDASGTRRMETFILDEHGSWRPYEADPRTFQALLAASHGKPEIAQVLLDVAARPEVAKLSNDDLWELLAHGSPADRSVAIYNAMLRAPDGLAMRWTQVTMWKAFHRSAFVNMAAGEGKSLGFKALIEMAVEMNGDGLLVHITTSKFLADRDYADFSKLIQALGWEEKIKIIRLDHHGGVPAPVKGQPTIYLGTKDDVGFSRLITGRLPGAPKSGVPSGKFKLSVDESDGVLFSSRDTFYLRAGGDRLASPEVAATAVLARKAFEHLNSLPGDEIRYFRTGPEGLPKLTKAGKTAVEEFVNDIAKGGGQIGKGDLAGLAGKVDLAEFTGKVELAKQAAELKFKTDYVIREVHAGKGERIVPLNADTHEPEADPHTSSLVRFNDGLGQALEAKHGLRIFADDSGSKSITMREIVREFDEVFGASGTNTRMGGAFAKILGKKSPVQIEVIPRYYRSRLDLRPDVVTIDQAAKMPKIADDAATASAQQPVLVLAHDNALVRPLFEAIEGHGVEVKMIDAEWLLEQGKNRGATAEALFAWAGKPGRVLVANMVGARGADIKLAPEASKLGLHVIVTAHSPKLEIDLQAIYRAARSGDIGSAIFYVSPEDPILAARAGNPAVGRATGMLITASEAAAMHEADGVLADGTRTGEAPAPTSHPAPAALHEAEQAIRDLIPVLQNETAGRLGLTTSFVPYQPQSPPAAAQAVSQAPAEQSPRPVPDLAADPSRSLPAPHFGEPAPAPTPTQAPNPGSAANGSSLGAAAHPTPATHNGQNSATRTSTATVTRPAAGARHGDVTAGTLRQQGHVLPPANFGPASRNVPPHEQPGPLAGTHLNDMVSFVNSLLRHPTLAGLGMRASPEDVQRAYNDLRPADRRRDIDAVAHLVVKALTGFRFLPRGGQPDAEAGPAAHPGLAGPSSAGSSAGPNPSAESSPGPFRAQVGVEPLSGKAPDGEGRYKLDQVGIQSLVFSDSDRGPTRYGEKQRSHTTAWTLTRQALANFALREAKSLAGYIKDSTDHLNSAEVQHGQEDSWERAKKVLAEKFKSLEEPRPLHEWSSALTELLISYVGAYQLSPVAVYANGSPDGRGEPGAMEKLRELENQLRTNSGAAVQLAGIEQAVAQLADINQNASLPAGNVKIARRHFWETLSVAFPLITEALFKMNDSDYMQESANDIQQTLEMAKKPKVLPGIADWMKKFQNAAGDTGAPLPLRLGALATGFVADVEVAPVDGASAMSENPAKSFAVRKISLSVNERPKTQYDAKQNAHMVSWALIKKATASRAGESLDNVISWVRESLEMIRQYPPKVSGAKFAESWHEIIEQMDGLLEKVDESSGQSLAAYQWAQVASSLVRGYLILHNVHRLATGTAGPSELAMPMGHGEAGTFKKLDELESMGNLNSEASIKAALGLLDSDAVRAGVMMEMLTGYSPAESLKDYARKLAAEYKDSEYKGRETLPQFKKWLKGKYPDAAALEDGLREFVGNGQSKAIKGKINKDADTIRIIDEWIWHLKTLYPSQFKDMDDRLRKAAMKELASELSEAEGRLFESPKRITPDKLWTNVVGFLQERQPRAAVRGVGDHGKRGRARTPR